jgi:DNA-binding Xre family transcriptional regulator
MYNKFHTVDEQYLFDELKLLIKKTPSKLQIMRNKRFLSQSQLAKISNTPLSTIQKLEVKDRDINKLNMIAFGKIIHALNCQPDDILEN